jgi:hypothetical protein
MAHCAASMKMSMAYRQRKISKAKSQRWRSGGSAAMASRENNISRKQRINKPAAAAASRRKWRRNGIRQPQRNGEIIEK